MTDQPATLTPADFDAEAQRRHGAGWGVMDEYQRQTARELVRQDMIINAYPRLVAELDQMREARDDAHQDLTTLNAEITEANRRAYETGVHLAQARAALREVLFALGRMPDGNARAHLVDPSHIARWRSVLDSTGANR